jgi:hypothetical protein
MDELLAMYREGSVTAAHLVAECLHMIDPENPGLVLDPLTEELRIGVLEYVQRYQPHRMVSNYGVLPTPDQVDAARKWLEDHDAKVDGRIVSGTEWGKSQTSRAR